MMPHGHCYLWREELLWTHVLSDGLIAAAYASIPAALIYLVWKRKDLEFNWMFVLFGVFILACGTTHILAIVSVWEPIYYVSAGVKVVTAAASVGTAITLWPLIPQIMKIPSPSQLQAVNDNLADEVEQHRSARVRLLEQSKELKIQAEQLLASNRQLSEANEMVRAYFDAAATEIQGPVAVADADLDRVRSCLEGGLVEDGKEILGSVRLRLRKVQQSVEQVLAKASLEVWEPELENFGVDEIVDDVRRDFGMDGTSGSASIEVNGNLPYVHSDRIGVKLVLSNAVSAMTGSDEGSAISHLLVEAKPLGFCAETSGPAWEIRLYPKPADAGDESLPLPKLDSVVKIQNLCTSVMSRLGGGFALVPDSDRVSSVRILLSPSEQGTLEA